MQKAEAIAPNNPRVIFSKAEFEIGGAKFGDKTQSRCVLKLKAIGLLLL
jgi:hypothetical protein